MQIHIDDKGAQLRLTRTEVICQGVAKVDDLDCVANELGMLLARVDEDGKYTPANGESE